MLKHIKCKVTTRRYSILTEVDSTDAIKELGLRGGPFAGVPGEEP